MVERSNKYLIVVCILKGIRFPPREHHKLICEGRFAGECLSSDAVIHDISPDFSQELAWEVDKCSLHQHKLNRTPIKLEIYSQKNNKKTVTNNSKNNNKKDFIGYVVLDVMSCGSYINQNTKWYSLIRTTYSKGCPALQVNTYIDHPQQLKPQLLLQQQQPTHHILKQQIHCCNNLQPSLNLSTGCYHLGIAAMENNNKASITTNNNKTTTNNNKLHDAMTPENSDVHTFVFSVAIAMAANLTQLIPNHSVLTDAFFFHYNLLDSNITTQLFDDLLSPSFSVDRASIRLKSTLNDLQQYFSQSPHLKISLCSGSQVIASCHVPINKLATSLGPSTPTASSSAVEVLATLAQIPLCLEDLFELTAAAGGGGKGERGEGGVVAEEERAVVGVSVLLKLQEQDGIANARNNKNNNKEISNNHNKITNRMVTGDNISKDFNTKKVNNGDMVVSDVGSTKSNINKNNNKNNNDRISREVVLDSVANKNTNNDNNNQNLNNNVIINSKNNSNNNINNNNNVNLNDNNNNNNNNPINNNNINVTDHSTHHYNLSIELTSITITHPFNQSLSLILKYNYLFFSTPIPVTTNPPIHVNSTDLDPHIGKSYAIPRSYCSFDFASSYHNTLHNFQTLPLVVEVWNKENENEEVFIAFVQVDLSLVLKSPTIQTFNEGNLVLPFKKKSSIRLPISSNKDHSIKLGSLEMDVTFEDWGSVPGEEDHQLQQQHNQPSQQQTQQQHFQQPQQNTNISEQFTTQNTNNFSKKPTNYLINTVYPNNIPNILNNKLSNNNNILANPNNNNVIPNPRLNNNPVNNKNYNPTTNNYNNPTNNNLNIPTTNNISNTNIPNTNNIPNNNLNTSNTIRATTEYRTAMKLELWRNEQMEIFQKKMEEKEGHIEERLEKEFKKRERERVVMSNKQRVEYERMKEKLRKSLDELETREKLLASNESELQARQREQDRQQQRRSEEIIEATTRMKEHCLHNISLQRNKSLAAEETAAKLKEQLIEMEAKQQRLLKQLDQLRDKQLDVKLQSETARLTVENESLHRQLSEACNHKEHYKHQWTTALNIIAKYKDRDLQKAIETQRKQEEELEGWKARSRIESEMMEVRKERGDVREMVQGLYGIQQNDPDHEGNKPKYASNNVDFDKSEKEDKNESQQIERMKVARLREERKLLIRTGVYGDRDALIVKLDTKIKQALKRES